MHAQIITLALALAPSSPTPTDRAPPFEVADVEIEQVDNAAHLATYDAEGENTATLSVWVDEDGRTHLDADFADGLYLSATVDGEEVTIESPNAVEVAARAEAIEDWMSTNHPQGKPWVPCAIGVVSTVVGLAHANPWTLLTVYATTCTCLPVLVEEWEDISCPGFG